MGTAHPDVTPRRIGALVAFLGAATIVVSTHLPWGSVTVAPIPGLQPGGTFTLNLYNIFDVGTATPWLLPIYFCVAVVGIGAIWIEIDPRVWRWWARPMIVLGTLAALSGVAQFAMQGPIELFGTQSIDDKAGGLAVLLVGAAVVIGAGVYASRKGWREPPVAPWAIPAAAPEGPG